MRLRPSDGRGVVPGPGAHRPLAPAQTPRAHTDHRQRISYHIIKKKKISGSKIVPKEITEINVISDSGRQVGESSHLGNLPSG